MIHKIFWDAIDNVIIQIIFVGFLKTLTSIQKIFKNADKKKERSCWFIFYKMFSFL